MKKLIVNSQLDCLTALILMSVCSMDAWAEPATWEIDPEHFSISFAVEHIGYQQQMGLFLEGAGSFTYDPEARVLDSGRVEIQADSVFSNHDARDNHLRGGDFLDAGNYPLLSFEATSFAANPGDGNHGTLSGDLTMIGSTHPIELQVVINKRENYPFGHRQETLGVSASTTISRSRWGMDYGVGNNLVGDEVVLRFEFEAIKQQ